LFVRNRRIQSVSFDTNGCINTNACCNTVAHRQKERRSKKPGKSHRMM
jgi:hypothetical protein